MEFAAIQILILGGTAAILIPVLIHLFNRTRFFITDWAAMEFLLAALKKTRRRVRLENLILLLLRIFVLLFLALMLSRPSVEGSVPLPKKTHLVIVLDNSYSMGARHADQTALERATALIEANISKEQLPDGSAFSLIRTSETLADYSRPTAETPGAANPNPAATPGPANASASADAAMADAIRKTIESLKEDLERQNKEREALEQRRTALDVADEAGAKEIADKLAENARKKFGLERDLAERQGELAEAVKSAKTGAENRVIKEQLFTTEREVIRRKLRSTSIVPRDPNWPATLRLTVEALKATESRYEVKRVVFVTDMQARNFPAADSPQVTAWREAMAQIAKESDGKPRFVDVGSVAINRTLVSARLQDQVIGIGVPLKLSLTVANNSVPRGKGDAGQNEFKIWYSIDGGRERRLEQVDIREVQPGQTRTVSATLPKFDAPGTHSIVFSLDDDDLMLDNRVSLVVDVIQWIDLLVVDGDPGDRPSRSETFFFMVALPKVSEDISKSPEIRQPGSDKNWKPKTAIKAHLTTAADLQGVDFYNYNAIVLANVRLLNQAYVIALERYVASGGCVVFTLGDTIQYASDADKDDKGVPLKTFYKNDLWRNGEGLFPLKLGKPQVMGDTAGLKMVPVEPYHRCIADLMEQDKRRGTKFVQEATFYQYVALEWPNPAPAHIRRLINLSQQTRPGEEPPALLISSRFGRGQVVVFTSSLDGRWAGGRGNSQPLYSSFIEFWQELVYALAETPNEHKHLRVGEPYRRPVAADEFSQNNFIFPPNANPNELDQGLVTPVRNLTRGERENSFRGELYFTDTDAPGVYTVKILKQRDPLRSLVRELLDQEAAVPPARRRPLAEAVANSLMEHQDQGTLAQENALKEIFKHPENEVNPLKVDELAGNLVRDTARLVGPDKGRTVVDRFAVNLETAESDLLKLAETPAALAEKLRALIPGVSIEVVAGVSEDPKSGDASNSIAPKRSRIWRYVCIVVLTFLGLEMLVAWVLTARQR